MSRPVARRDFLEGVALAATVGAATPAFANAVAATITAQAAQNASDYYPPGLLGMRGDQPGSFQAAHALRDDNFWNQAHALTDTGEFYDLVVVGGGISGLAAAFFYRTAKPKAKILIVENHDDFGGHARRNEFLVNGRTELINGGSLDIDSPTPYSAVSSGLLKSLGVDPARLEKECADSAVYRGLKIGIFFDRETFGADKLVPIDMDEDGKAAPEAWKAFVAKSPLSDSAKQSILRIETGQVDYFPGLTGNQKKEKLWHTSYRDYLLHVVRADPAVIPLYQHRSDEEWGVGADAISALDSWGMGYPGFAGLKLEPGGPALKHMGYTPAGYSTTGGSEFFHFPDGNASIARLLVRTLIPGSMPGHDAQDIVTARCDYAKLDRPENQVRVRLNNLVVRVRNLGNAVEVAYGDSRGSKEVYRVRAGNCVLACWNMIIPWLMPELPEKQKEALRNLVKTPLVYASVALRNWRSLHKLGVRRVYAPGEYFSSLVLNPVLNIGNYHSPRAPGDPVLLRMVGAFASPGLSEYDQNRAGRAKLLQTSFEEFERHIRDELGRILGLGGFDPARDIEGICINRWAHGYAPEYNALWEKNYDAEHTPNLIARRRSGRVAIANSDSGYAAFTDVAIDQAHRAVEELLSA
jgi:spermidine dehydrogenase